MQSSEPLLVVLGTGGTIAGTAGSSSEVVGYVSAQLGIEALLASVPDLAVVPLACEQVAQIDSKDATHAFWQRLAVRVAHHLARDEVGGIVVTHGTDTLEETAYFLQRVLAPRKPVVLTAAMRPATALQADGPQNLLDASRVARDAGGAGVLAVLAGRIHSARAVRKVHPYRLDAFGSGDDGPLGVVESGRVRWFGVAAAASNGACATVEHTNPHPAAAAALSRAVADWPRVEIIVGHAGSTGSIARALAADGVDGLVVACTGNGSLHVELESALLAAQSDGVRVLRSLRCGDGRLLTKSGDALPGADDLLPVKARIELLLDLMSEPIHCA